MNPHPPRLRIRFAVLMMPVVAAAVLALANSCAGGVTSGTPADPLGAEIARWNTFIQADTARDDNSAQVRASSSPALTSAAVALAHGRRELALLRLAAARTPLAALRYTREHPAAGRSNAAFDAEWTRMRGVLRGRLSPAESRALANLHPAAVRAIAEAALPQVRILFDAAPDYAHSTLPEYGLSYVGEAVAQDQFIDWSRTLTEPGAGAEPPFRSIAPEIETLQARMLAVYRPPVSIERHPEFINASSVLKEARELDAAGLRHGALLRYLQGVLRFQPLRDPPPAFDSLRTPATLRAFAARIDRAGVDHGIARVFLELAQADMDDTTRGAAHATAAAVAAEVLPRYFAALAPAPPAAARPPAEVTVTLVRWPYT